MGTLRKQRQDGAPRTCKSGWERRQLWIRMWTRAAWSEGCLCGLTLTVSAASLCLFVMFSPHPISAYPHCPTNNVFFFFFFLLTSFLAPLPQNWKHWHLLWQQETWLLCGNWPLNTLFSLPLYLQLYLLIGLPYCFPHYIDMSVSRLYLEHIFRWINTVYLSLGSCYPACITCLL